MLTQPSTASIRSLLHDMLRRELIGPQAGETEEVDEGRVSYRYLTGWLAPLNTTTAEDVDDGALDALVSGDEGEEDGAEPDIPQSASMLPNSFGLTFRVDSRASAFRLTASWARYDRRPSTQGLLTKEGRPKTVWARVPYSAQSDFSLSEEGIGAWAPCPELPEVQVTGRIRKLADGSRLVTLFLRNGLDNSGGDANWLFQARLEIESPSGDAVLMARSVRPDDAHQDPADRHAAEELRMAYRDRREFAVGHGVSVDWSLSDHPARAHRIWTTPFPSCEVPKSPPTAIPGLETRMAALGDAEADLTAQLSPLPAAYAGWIRNQELRLRLGEAGLGEHHAAGERTLARARRAEARIRAGIELLASDENARRAFRFANRAMHDQRLHSILSRRVRRGETVKLAQVAAEETPAWYPFQLAFILINLPGLTCLDHPDRSGEDPVADLLWFPTGGGKTEAYLGLTAYVLALRRLQGRSDGCDGSGGVGVLMRYTLRLLTLQQFQRATALICACEVLRRRDPGTWGETPFRIGLWAGRDSTPNSYDQAEKLIENEGQGRGTLMQLTCCPWCGRSIGRAEVQADPERRRILTYCSDPMGRCAFSVAKSAGEGIPICLVDEEVYRLLPGLMIATVDKFAQLPWNGETRLLFGGAGTRCTRHGYLCPASDHPESSHRKTDRLPAATVGECLPLRPPDLIIQDELHLITGPLGSLVGIYETAVDALCSRTVSGRRVGPKVIASTATIQRAGDQVNALFHRRLEVFPPPGLDAGDSFFAVEDRSQPGQLYVGICATGRRLKAGLISVYTACLCAAQKLFDNYGEVVDPYMTLVGYFNSLRELGGMRRLIDDDIRSRAWKMDRRGLASRTPTIYDELTSRKPGHSIPRILDRLEWMFMPSPAKGDPRPYDILIATNMISVGVDVPRLGLMVVAGQPKMTAEYIQATSRVGRTHPGLVLTVLNWARPRDLSHFEQFHHYHETYHTHVESPSVTPFSVGARDRGLSAVLVALARQGSPDCNDEDGAQRVLHHTDLLDRAADAVRARVQGTHSAGLASDVLHESVVRRDRWLHSASLVAVGAGSLVYDRAQGGHSRPLLRRAETGKWGLFTCPGSLREVEQTSPLLLYELPLFQDASGPVDDEEEEE